MRSWLVVALAACSSAEAKDPPTIVPMLPCMTTAQLDPWDHELFPSCPTMPYHFGLEVCPRGTCPKPCRAEVEQLSPEKYKGTAAQSVTYDASGRWVSSSGANSKHEMLDWSCSYKSGRMDVCKQTFDGKVVKTVTLKRDAKNRVISLDEDSDFVGKRSVPITYDAAGHVTRMRWADKPVMSDEYTYDAKGRLATIVFTSGTRVSKSNFKYNAAGSLVEDTGDGERYEYDSRGRLAKVTSRTDAGFNTNTLAYDDEDRLVQNEHRTSDGQFVTVYRYTYSCK